MTADPRAAASQRHVALRYAVALLAVAAAALLRGALEPWLDDGLPFVLVFGAVALAVWFGGTGPAVMAAAVGFVAHASLYMDRSWLSAPWDASHFVTLGSYAFSTGLIILFGRALLQSRRQCEDEVAQRRLAQDATLAERRRLEITLKSIGDGVLVCDTEGRVRSVNPVAQQLIGWSEDEARGRSLLDVFDIVNEATGDRVENPALRALKEGVIVGLANHTVLRSRDGSMVPIEDSAAPIVGDDGGAIGAVLVFRDARAQRETEHRLLQAHEALYVVVQALPMAVVVLDTGSRRIRLWNGAAERLFGRAATDVVGRSIDDVQPRHDEARARQLARIEAGEVLQDVQLSVQAADGRSVPVRLSAAPLLDAAGQVTGSLLLLADLSERLRIEASLRQSDATLRAFFDNAPAGIGVVELTDDDDILHLQDNPVTCRLFGVAPGGTVLRRASELGASAELIALWLVHYRQSAALGQPVAFEYSHDSQGVTLRYRATVCCIGDDAREAGSRTRFCYMAEDITERKRSEEALAQADRRKDEFIATLAHELRNPLAPLRNGVQLLRILMDPETASDAKARSAAKPLDIMERQISHMVRLIDDLLDVGRVSGDKLELQRHRMDIADAVHQAVETTQPLIQEAGHRLTVVLPGAPVFVNADVTRLCQVLANLLNNAVKYTSDGGSIRLSVEAREPGWVEICVEDNGRGLAPETLPQIFQMFAQFDRQFGRSAGGLGIGLSIARKLVRMHGGELRAASAGLGQGSSFVVRLPRADDGVPVPALSGERPPVLMADRHGRLRTGCRVLIADDNIDAADSLNNLVQLMGCASRVARDGAEAYRLAEALRPDIALLDIGMPELNGNQLARKIRSQSWGQAVKLVAVTGWGQEADVRASTEAGFDLHWVKPVDPAALDALIEGVSAARSADASPVEARPPGA